MAEIVGRYRKTVAIGGETTGNKLEEVVVKIDISKIPNFQPKEGQRIKVSGDFEDREGVETGSRWVFVANSAHLVIHIPDV